MFVLFVPCAVQEGDGVDRGGVDGAISVGVVTVVGVLGVMTHG